MLILFWILLGEMKIKDFFKKWWHKESKPFTYKDLMVVNSTTDVPLNFLSKTIYLVYRDGKNRWIIFDCPGGHKKRIEINLMESKRPYWKINVINKKVSLYPSVAVFDKSCNCHFWLKNNIAQKAYF